MRQLELGPPKMGMVFKDDLTDDVEWIPDLVEKQKNFEKYQKLKKWPGF